MPVLPVLRPRDVIKIFEHFGWQIARQRGSHIVLIKPGNIATLSIPNHSEVARGTLRSLINKSGISIESFIEVSQKL
jgi:predicted RNA binding protein YcfA (HicA-like mRNA interferase family)